MRDALAVESAIAHVLFRLGRQAFAIPLAAVKDVQRAPAITPVPHAPAMVRGVSVLREQLVATLDLRARFGLPMSNQPDKFTALVVDYAGERVALLVDRVEDVLSLPPAEPGTPSRDPLWQGVIAGIIQRDQDTIVVLDVAGILDGVENAARARNTAGT